MRSSTASGESTISRPALRLLSQRLLPLLLLLLRLVLLPRCSTEGCLGIIRRLDIQRAICARPFAFCLSLFLWSIFVWLMAYVREESGLVRFHCRISLFQFQYWLFGICTYRAHATIPDNRYHSNQAEVPLAITEFVDLEGLGSDHVSLTR